MAEKKTKISTTNFIILILIISIVLIGIKELCESIQYKKTDTIVEIFVFFSAMIVPPLI